MESDGVGWEGWAFIKRNLEIIYPAKQLKFNTVNWVKICCIFLSSDLSNKWNAAAYGMVVVS